MATELSAAEFARRLGDKRVVDEARKNHMGLAIYSTDGRGQRLVITTSTRDADWPGAHPPRLFGGAELEAWMPPAPALASMVSPLKAALDDQSRIPQIHRPRVSPPRTEYPEVLISGRTSSHPRGDQNGYITPGRPSPVQEEPSQPPPPPEPVSGDISWWADALRGTTRSR
jgi:hypothetical protein